MSKTIKIGDETHKKLKVYQATKEYKTLSDTIMQLLKGVKK